MNTVNNPLVDAYLAQLERELDGLPDAVVRDILDGVREELAGLDADQAEVIIEQLGDPAFIAAEARAAAEPLSLSPQREPRGYVFLTAMIVALGGVIIPVVGWVVGVVMMWLSTSWRTWEKWVATLTPLLVLIAGYVATLIAKLAARPAEGDGDLHGPRFENFFPSANPFQAAYFEFRIDAIVLFFASNFIVGMWLLWRGLRKPDAGGSAAGKAAQRGGVPVSRPKSVGYVVTATLLVALGGALVPLLGWVVGIVMVWASGAWRTWEKWLATLLPLVTVAVTVVALLEVRGWGAPPRYATYQPEPMPFAISDVMWSAVLAFAAANCISGVVLLWQALRRRG